MKYTREQRQKAYKSLPEEVQSFISYSETDELIEGYLLELGLDEDTTNLSDSEILFGMYGLQTLQQTIENISKISGKKMNELDSLKNNLQINIFDKIQSLKDSEITTQPNQTGDVAKTFSVPKISEAITERINEVSAKYTLNGLQKSTLLDIVYSTNSDPLTEKSLVSKIFETLKVSEILADQITQDLKKRVFEFSQIKTSAPKPIEKKNPAIPEIRPVNTPMVEEDVPTISVPNYTSTFKPKSSISDTFVTKPTSEEAVTKPLETKPSTPTETVTPSRINFGKTPVVESSQSSITSEEVQRPVFVPKFTGTPLNDVLENAESKPANSTDIISNKLSGVTTNTVNKVEEKPSTPIEKSYSVDPYREPLA